MTKVKEIMTSKNTKTLLFVSIITAMILPFSAMGYAETQTDQAEKTSIKNSIEAKMQEQVRKDQDETRQYTSDEYGIPYNLIFEDNGKLIVGIDIEKAQEFTEDYSVEEVKSDLQTSQDIEVNYYGFDREASIRGGYPLDNQNVPDDEALSTLTLVRNNKLITTGHVIAINHLLATGASGSAACVQIKIIKNPSADPQGADAAIGKIIHNPACSNTFVENSIKYKNKYYSVTDGTTADITVGKKIHMAGAKTGGTSGQILDNDVRAKDGDGTLTHQVVATYTSDGGDSGAPVFSLTGAKSVKILGQHVGKFCLVDLHNTSPKMGYWCTDAQGTGALTVFSPWPAVKSNLGI